MGRLIEREIRRRRDVGTVAGLVRASGVSRSAIYDAIAGEPHVQHGTYARIEAGLGLPTDTLHTVGDHDLAGLAELGVQLDLIEWVRRAVRTSPGQASAGGLG